MSEAKRLFNFVCIVSLLTINISSVFAASSSNRPVASANTATSRLPQITSIHPSQISCGKNVTIRGQRFGGQRKTVRVVLRGTRFTIPVVSWKDTVVHAKVPSVLSTLLDGQEVKATLQLKNKEGTAQKTCWLRPTTGVEAPLIDSHPSSVRPGWRFTLAGRRFGKDGGTVHLRGQGKNIKLKVHSWKEQHIIAELPSQIKGLKPAVMQLIVSPPHRKAAKANIHFEPNYVYRILVEQKECHQGVAATLFPHTLKNGWHVLYAEASGGNATTSGDQQAIRYEKRPKKEDTNTELKVSFRFREGTSSAWCTFGLLVRGPAGVAPGLPQNVKMGWKTYVPDKNLPE